MDVLTFQRVFCLWPPYLCPRPLTTYLIWIFLQNFGKLCFKNCNKNESPPPPQQVKIVTQSTPLVVHTICIVEFKKFKD
jgi:hypothetical protein